MTVTRDDALRIFGERYGSLEVEIWNISDREVETEVYPIQYNVWSIAFGPVEPSRLIQASRRVCISKCDGQIVFDGWARDEG